MHAFAPGVDKLGSTLPAPELDDLLTQIDTQDMQHDLGVGVFSNGLLLDDCHSCDNHHDECCSTDTFASSSLFGCSGDSGGEGGGDSDDQHVPSIVSDILSEDLPMISAGLLTAPVPVATVLQHTPGARLIPRANAPLHTLGRHKHATFATTTAKGARMETHADVFSTPLTPPMSPRASVNQHAAVERRRTSTPLAGKCSTVRAVPATHTSRTSTSTDTSTSSASTSAANNASKKRKLKGPQETSYPAPPSTPAASSAYLHYHNVATTVKVETAGHAAYMSPTGCHQGVSEVPTLRWQAQARSKHCWQPVLDASGKPHASGELALELNIQADKGFVYSPLDKAFVCQRKNHFQLSVSLPAADTREALYIDAGPGKPLHALTDVFVYVHACKVEDSASIIQVEQASSNRSRAPFEPIRLSVPLPAQPRPQPQGATSRLPLPRLHFSETTANNIRKGGLPNPGQRFFSLGVSVLANVRGRSVMLAAFESQRIIVRASSLSQFSHTNKAVLQRQQHWFTGDGDATDNATVHHGRVGINNVRPTEALAVHGNVQVTGAILQPSDRRVKENLRPMDTAKQLDNIKRLNLYEYELKEAWARQAGRTHTRTEQGIIAQQVQQIIPEAVRDTHTDVQLGDVTVKNLLTVNKERIFMEGVGAVQQLGKLVETLEARVEQLETQLGSHQAQPGQQCGRPCDTGDGANAGSGASTLCRDETPSTRCMPSTTLIGLIVLALAAAVVLAGLVLTAPVPVPAHVPTPTYAATWARGVGQSVGAAASHVINATCMPLHDVL